MRTYPVSAAHPVNPQSQYTGSNRATARRYGKLCAEASKAGVENSLEATRSRGPAAVTERMANFIVERVANDGACTEQQLRNAGFTEDDLKHMTAAARLAAKKAPGLQGCA